MKEKYQKQIEREFRTCVEDTISRIQESDETYRPFHPALLSKEALFWSRFERSFSTSFGQRTIGRLAEIAAYSNGDRDTTRQKETMVRLDKAFFDAVNLHDEQIRSGDRRNRDWNKALSVVAGRYVSLAFLALYSFCICILLDGGSVNSNTVAFWRSCKRCN